ncbi:hypothetical protein GCM10011494_11210 [Novosphingobium endophyticum]|uniref:Uncharacterized protein n=1 Tax=Novosphingobium endophyticum TaxID=1955250 RepID=A0A916X4R6_9SPHN|nr:hypothetical protein [Novosphingobium endophyticum]GGB94505.1 hypothetical protein GCM10011494_11210 [Novosphingobium endophyticum]
MQAGITIDGTVEDEFGQPGHSEPETDSSESALNHPRLDELRELAEPDADPGQEPQAWELPPPPDHITGTQLRRRIVTEESIAALEATKRPSLLQRLFRRNQTAN